MKGRQLARFQGSGVIRDAAPNSVPEKYWTAARDVVFRDHAERIQGRAQVFGTPGVPPEYVQFARGTNYAPVWLYAGAAGAWIADGVAHTDVTPADWEVATDEGHFTGGDLNGVPVLSTGAGAWYWPGTGPLTLLPGWGVGDATYALRPFRYHLIALGWKSSTEETPDMVRWSAAAAPGEVPASWTPAATNEAGYFTLSETPGAVIDGAVLRGAFVAYKNRSCYLIDYIGGAKVFAQRVLFTEIGVMARHCICKMAENHIVLTEDDLVIHDGTSVRSLVEGRIRREMFRNADGDALRRSFVVPHASAGEVWVCMAEPGAAYPNVAYVWNRARDVWGVRELPEQPAHIAVGAIAVSAGGGPAGPAWDTDSDFWDIDTDVWDTGTVAELGIGELLEACPGVAPGAFYAVDAANTRDGELVAGFLERTGLSCGAEDRYKTVKRVWIDATGTPGDVLAIRLGASTEPNGDPVYGAPALFTIGSGSYVNLYATGRWFGVRIEGAGAADLAPWRVQGLQLEFDLRGHY